MKYLVLFFALLGITSSYALEGQGTPESPFIISTENDLFSFADTVNLGYDSAHAVQSADIVLEKEWNPFGNGENKYKGSYDGQNFKIENLTIKNDSVSKLAFCSYAKHATLKNIHLKNCNISTTMSSAAGICAYAEYTTIDGCVVEGSISSYNGCAGIVSDLSYASIVKNCTNKASITVSMNNAGGICETAQSNSKIINCFNEGNIVGKRSLGGIVGNIYSNGVIAYCGNVGNVTDISASGDYIAGLAGKLKSSVLISSYNTGTIKGGAYQTGALTAGDNLQDTIFKNCFYREGCATLGDGSKTYALGVQKGWVPRDDKNRSVITFNDSSIVSSGALCCLLNKNMPGDSIVWFQKCGEGYPKTDSTLGTVYMSTEIGCDGLYNSNTTFKNSMPEDVSIQSHDYEAYKCKRCGYVIPDYVKMVNGYYPISNADELRWFANFVNSGHYDVDAKLTDDIYLNDTCFTNIVEDSTLSINIWTPIGKSNPYTGSFDGQGFSISGLYFNTNYDRNNSEDFEKIGLFGSLDHAEIKNVTIDCSYVYGSIYVGSIAGYLIDHVTIENCHNHSTVNGGHLMGGVVGHIDGKYNTVIGCSNSGTIDAVESYGEGYIGGVIGCIYGDSTYVRKCCNYGTISGPLLIGGVVGYSSNFIDIDACYNVGDITGLGNIGGIGSIYKNADFRLTRCFNIGKITNLATSSRNSGMDALLCNGRNNQEKCHDNYYLYDLDHPSSSIGIPTSAVDFESGQICYLLNNSVTDGTQPFYQNLAEVRGDTAGLDIANGIFDKYPVLDKSHRTVYFENNYYNYIEISSLEETNTDNSLSIHIQDKDIIISEINGFVTLYDIYGRMLQKVSSDGERDVRLTVPNQGIYFVVVGDNLCKIRVK